MATLYVGNDMRLALEGTGKLKDELGNPVPGATVKATIYKQGMDTGVDGVTWPLTLSEGDKDGEYYGIIPGDADIQVGEWYRIELDVESPGGTKALWYQDVKAEYRRF